MTSLTREAELNREADLCRRSTTHSFLCSCISRSSPSSRMAYLSLRGRPPCRGRGRERRGQLGGRTPPAEAAGNAPLPPAS